MTHVTRLVPCVGNTRYVVRFRSRNPPAYSDGVNVCFVNEHGDALLKRLSWTGREECNEHIFNGPDIRNVSNLLVAPETGTWHVKDIQVSVSHVENEVLQYMFSYNFSYDNEIGKRGGDMAAVLVPQLMPDAKELEALKHVSDAEYVFIKEHMITTMTELTLIGALITTGIGGIDKGYAFALGGSVGLLYLFMLQKGVDDVGKMNVFGGSALRLGALSVLAAGIVHKHDAQIASDHWFFGMGILGFLMYRLAMVVSYCYPKEK